MRWLWMTLICCSFAFAQDEPTSDDGIQPTAEDDEIALKRTYWEAYQQWPREIEITA